MKLAIIVGHEDEKRGAQMAAPHSFISEYEFNKVLAAMIQSLCMPKNIECGVFFRDKVGIVGAYRAAQEWGPKAIVELHFNSFGNASVDGTETLYGEIRGSKYLAEAIHDQICQVFVRNKSSNRGAKLITKEQRGGGNVNNQSGLPSVLIEPFFGSNPDECAFALDNMPELALAVVDGFTFWQIGSVNKFVDVH